MLYGASWTTLQRFLPVQCCPKSVKTTVIRTFSGAMFFLGGGLLDNIAQGFYLFNVGPWLTDNFCEKNSLCNVVLTMLGQHCIRILSSQCFLNVSLNGNIIQKKYCATLAMGAQTMVLQENKPQRCLDLPEPTLPKKITFAMLAQSTQIYFCRKTRFLNMLGGLCFLNRYIITK